uniref:Thyroid receptor-interacting protein 11 n=1 Tax=Syphacia muris TaxID=451379 RepID=A0A0N5ACP7_9BILA
QLSGKDAEIAALNLTIEEIKVVKLEQQPQLETPKSDESLMSEIADVEGYSGKCVTDAVFDVGLIRKWLEVLCSTVDLDSREDVGREEAGEPFRGGLEESSELFKELQRAVRVMCEARSNEALDCLQKEIEEKRMKCLECVEQKNKAESSVLQQKQLLCTANQRIEELEMCIREKDSIIRQLSSGQKNTDADAENSVSELEMRIFEKNEKIQTLQRENWNLQNEINCQLAQLRNGTSKLEALLLQVEELEAALKEREPSEWTNANHEQQKTTSDLKKQCQDITNYKPNENTLIEAQSQAATVDSQKTAAESPVQKPPESENLRQAAPSDEDIEKLRKELDDIRSTLDDCNRDKEVAEWHLGEHKQWLSDANGKIKYLEEQLSGKDAEITALNSTIEEMKVVKLEQQPQLETPKSDEPSELVERIRELEEKLCESENLRQAAPSDEDIEKLRKELDDIRSALDDCNRDKEVAEWHLGEHKQWLSDANGKIKYLEEQLSGKDAEIAALNSTIEGE